MKKLNREHISAMESQPTQLTIGPLQQFPVKVIQFGEGNFLRAFVDWMINTMNRKGLFNGSIRIIQPLANGMISRLNDQDGLYTVIMRGIRQGNVVSESEIVTAIEGAINPYSDYDAFLASADLPELRFVVSNTTEAGIAYSKGEQLSDAPQESFPGKLCAFLYRRFLTFKGDPAKGLIHLPCELIENNGKQLKHIVLKVADEWNLEKDFIDWLEHHNLFFNTLVDRIVTGYPHDEATSLTQDLGYDDQLLDTAELFHLWAIEGDSRHESELPLKKAGLDVVWTDSLAKYRTRKVRILNGVHTMTVLVAYLYGLDTVKECLDDPTIHAFMKQGIDKEIIPSVDVPTEELVSFADQVLERFANPFIRHQLLSIALNSVSKYKARVLPTLLEYVTKHQGIPPVLAFSQAALISFYRSRERRDGTDFGLRGVDPYNIQDDPVIVTSFNKAWSAYAGDLESTRQVVTEILGNESIWEQDLNQIERLTDVVASGVFQIETEGMKLSVETLLKNLSL